jgi:hypothetical protein
MADFYCRGEELLVDHIGGRDLRVMLLALEPGARIWLSLDGDVVQFERLADGSDGVSRREFRAIGETAHLWRKRLDDPKLAYVEELEIVERPKDAGGAAFGFYRANETETSF